MKINWKVRLKNPVFLASSITVLIGITYQVLEIVGIAPKIEKDSIINLVELVVSGLSLLGILVDPTTKGTNDSEQALEYTELH